MSGNRLEIRVKVPATSANLGPGFDCLGLALNIFNVVIIKPSDSLCIKIEGEGEGELSTGEDNLVYRAISNLYQPLDLKLPTFHIELHNHIPLARGLGSSAAAVVGGLVAANEGLGKPLANRDLLKLAYKLEGHLDNAAAALLGGLVVSVPRDDEIYYATPPVPEGLKAVLFIPELRIPTGEARKILPKQIDRKDAVFNLSHTALMVAAFASGDMELLKVATEDRLHQPYRQALFPAFPKLIAAALDAGELGAFLSGAGSTILALTLDKEIEIVQAFQQTAQRGGVAGRATIVGICFEGAEVESL